MKTPENIFARSVMTTCLKVSLFLFFASDCNAFDVDHFRSGMSKSDAMSVVKKLDKSARISSPYTDLVMIRASYNDGDSDVDLTLGICKGVLMHLLRKYDYNWDRAFNVINNLNMTYGNGAVTSKAKNNIYYDAFASFGFNGRLSTQSINYDWDNDVEWVSVRIVLTKELSPDGSAMPNGQQSLKITEHYMLYDNECFG